VQVCVCVGVVDEQSDADVADAGSECDADEVMVSVGCETVPFSEVTDAMVARMTTAQKDEYIRLGQQLYDQMNH